MITWAARRMYRPRSSSGSCAQNGWTVATSSTTACTWSGETVGTEPIGSPVPGLNDCSTWPLVCAVACFPVAASMPRIMRLPS